MKLETTLLLDGLGFPEGPRWHDGKLWFSDMHAHKVMSVDLEGHAETIEDLTAVTSFVYTAANSDEATWTMASGSIELVRVNVPGVGLP